MSDILGEGVIRVGIDDRSTAELERIRAEYHRTMQALGREEAILNVKGNLTDLKRTLKEGEALTKAHNAKMEALEKQHAESSGAETFVIERQIKELAAERDKQEEINGTLRERLQHVQDLYDSAKRTDAAVAQTAKRRSAENKKELAEWKTLRDAENRLYAEALEHDRERTRRQNQEHQAAIEYDRERTRRIKEVEAAEAKAQKLKEKGAKEWAKAEADAAKLRAKIERDSFNQMHADALAMNRERDKQTAAIKRAQDARRAAINRDIDDVVRLQQQYVKASQAFDKANKERAKQDTFKGRHFTPESVRFQTEVDGARAKAEMEALRARLQLIGARPIEIKVKEDHRGLHRVADAFSGFWEKLDKASVNVGPFTTRLRTLLAVVAVLAPVIAALVGALGALVAVTGAGLIGALGVAGTVMTGFGLAALGVVTAVKPMITQLTTAHAAVVKYRTAQAKADAMNKLYGKGSKEAASAVKAAAAAHQVMEDQLKAMDPAARKAVRGWDRLKKSWKDMTGPAASKAFGRVIGSTFQTLSDDMPMFAKRTNTALGSLSKGWSQWMAGLRSPEGKSILSNIFGDFNKMIPSIMHGLGSLGTAFGRIFQSFGRHSGELGKGFDKWATAIADATSHTGPLNARVDQLVGAMQSLGHFAQSAGRWLSAVFTPGIGPGIKLLQDMTNALDRHTDNMHKNASASTDFYQRSISMTEQLYHAIAPLITAFIHWGNIMRPFAKVALTVADAAASVTSSILGWKPLREIVTGLFAGFLAFKVVGKLLALGGAVVTLAKQIWALRGAWTALKIAFAEGGIRGALGKIAGVFSGAGKAAGAAAEIEAAFATGGAEAANLQAAAIKAAGAQVAGEWRAALAEGGVGAGAEIATAEAAGGEAAAAEIGTAETAAGTAAAGEIATAMTAAGTAAAAEIGTAEAGGGLVAGAETAAGAAGGAVATTAVKVTGAEAATEAVGGLGTALLGIVGAAGAAGLAALIFGGRAETAGEKAEKLSDSASKIADSSVKAVHSMSGQFSALADSTNNLQESQAQVVEAQHKINKLNQVPVPKRGAQWKAEMRQQIGALNQGIDGVRKYRASTYELRDSLTVTARRFNTLSGAVKTTKSAADKARVALVDNIDMTGEAAQKAGKQYHGLKNAPLEVLKSLETLAGKEDDQEKAVKEADKTEAAYVKTLKQAKEAQGDLGVVTVNYARALAGLKPIARTAADTVRQLTASIGTTKVQKIAVQFPDPRKAARVMSQMNRAISAGAPKGKTFSVVADARSAEQAIRRLNALRIQAKTLRILQQGGEETLARIKAVVGAKLATKVQKILAADDDARSKIKKLIALGIPVKTARILANDAQAQAVFRRVNSTILQPLTQSINRILGKRPELIPPPPTVQWVDRHLRDRPTAAGTEPITEGYNALIGEGGGPEWHVNTKTGAARRTVGSESVALQPGDAVIPTEPKYRRRGQQIFGSIAANLDESVRIRIARDLGLTLYAKGKVPNRLIPYDDKGKDKNVNLNKRKDYAGWHLESIPAGKDAKGKPVTKSYWVPPTWVMQGSTWVDPVKYRYRDPKYTEKQFQSGAVPIEAAAKIISAFQSGAKKIASIQKQIASTTYDIKEIDKELKHPKGKDAKEKEKEKKRLTKKRQTRVDRRKKLQTQKHHQEHLQRMSAGKYNLAQEDKAIIGQMGAFQDQISADDSNMTKAETVGSLDDWTTARNSKVTHLNTLIAYLKNARKNAKGDWKAELGRQLGAAQADLADTNNSAYQSQVSEDALLTKEQTALLEKITADVALESAGQADMYAAVWQKAYPNDTTAKQAAVDFWTDRLHEAQAAKRGPAVIAQIAGNLSAAQGDVGGDVQAGPTVGQLFGTARTELLRDFASNVYGSGVGSEGGATLGGGSVVTNSAYLPSAAGTEGSTKASALLPAASGMAGAAAAGSAMSGAGALMPAASGLAGAAAAGGAISDNSTTSASSSTSKTVNVTNNFQAPPPDPHSWSQGVAFEMGAAL